MWVHRATHKRKEPKANAVAARDRRKLSLSFALMRRNKKLWRYVVVSCLTYLPTGMVLPFTQLYASEAKNASPYILGAMVTASSLVSLFAGLPLGHPGSSAPSVTIRPAQGYLPGCGDSMPALRL